MTRPSVLPSSTIRCCCSARRPDRRQHARKIAAYLSGVEPDDFVSALLEPRRAGGIVRRLVGIGVNVAVDFDHQASFRARIGRHKGQYVSPNRKSTMKRPIGCWRRNLKPNWRLRTACHSFASGGVSG